MIYKTRDHRTELGPTTQLYTARGSQGLGALYDPSAGVGTGSDDDLVMILYR